MQKFVLLFCLSLPLFGLAQAKKSAAKSVATTGSLKQSINDGQVVYQKYCLTCHQADGSGVPNLNPPLLQTKWVLGSKAILIEQVLKGSKGKVEIEGETFHNTMPPLGQTLSDQQIADVLTYVRNSFGNKSSRVSAAEVKVVRAKAK